MTGQYYYRHLLVLAVVRISANRRRPFSLPTWVLMSAGELLRDSLADFLLAREISLESVIPVQYILAALPPHVVSEIKSENWVGVRDRSETMGLSMNGFHREKREREEDWSRFPKLAPSNIVSGIMTSFYSRV